MRILFFTQYFWPENFRINEIVENYKDQKIVFTADLLPSTGHIPLPYVMGYDTRPLTTLKEKSEFLSLAQEENWILYLEHDPVNECCLVNQTEKGIRLKSTHKLAEFL